MYNYYENLEYTEVEKKQLSDCNSCYMLGILATDEKSFPTSGEEQSYITIMKGSTNIIFYVKALSYEPEPILELVDKRSASPLYIGIDRYQNEANFPLSLKLTSDLKKKMQMIEEKLKGRLLIFKPKITIKQHDDKEIAYKNLEIVAIEPDVKVSNNQEYILVPKINFKNKDFEKKLVEGSYIYFEDYPHVMFQPNYILCGNYIYCNLKSWERSSNSNRRWRYTGDINDIKKVPIDMDSIELTNKLIRGTDNLIFIEKDYLVDNVDSKFDTKEAINISIYEVNNLNTQASTLDSTIHHDTDINEYKFLTALKEYTVKKGLCYDENDLINFHTCVKTNPLTIVAGMSGTGKTQLARAYAEMLDLSEDNNTLLFLPISPSYTEPGDLLGYLNNNNGLFIPSETRLTEFLIHAMENPNSMHMVIFDEMNLSQVEHWFAPFISLLELEPDKRMLSLYSKNAHCINSAIYYPTINIGSNIRFVGTVNMDETTKDFSDRLLDRANVITLKKRSFVSLKEEQKQNQYTQNTYEKFKCLNYSQYSSWVKNDMPLSAFTIEELHFFDELHNLINAADSQKGVSFRIVERIGNYINNIPINEDGELMLSRRVAIDIQVKQRILTKLKGTESQYGSLIGTMMPDNETPQNSALYEFFSSDTALEISNFEFTKQDIKRKAKELGIYGYTN
ncbi:MAG: AAA family ATPase [Caldicoprobacterales bacterium]